MRVPFIDGGEFFWVVDNRTWIFSNYIYLNIVELNYAVAELSMPPDI